MKIYELIYIFFRFFNHPLYYQINSLMRKLVKSESIMLDVGGRTSPQTIGLKCKVYVSELPRLTEIQEQLLLGLNDSIEEKIKKRRTNIEGIIYDDMAKSKMEDNRFDLISAIEVLEHVEQDYEFIKNVYNKLKKKGVFIMSTPNGDFIPNTNPDHVRHYRKKALEMVLASQFSSINVFYSVIRKPFFSRAYQLSSRIKMPLGPILGGIFYFLSILQSNLRSVKNKSSGTCYLVAICRK